MTSKYLERFNQVEKQCGDLHELIGDCIYVEEIPEEEVKTKSGLILSTAVTGINEIMTDQRPKMVLVLAVGKGFYNEETGEDVPLGVAPGDIIIVSALSVEWFNIFGGMVCEKDHRIGLTRESEIRHRFKGVDSYEQIFKILRGDGEQRKIKKVRGS